MLRVALLRDFDEPRLFGVRLYAERLRRAIATSCAVAEIHPWPDRSAGPDVLRPLQTLLVKEILYPLQVRRIRADVAHVLDQSHAHLVRFLGGAASVVTCHDLWGLRYGRALRRFGYRRRVLAMRGATRVVAVSESARQEAIALGVHPDRVVVVRNRVDRFFLTAPPATELDAVSARFGLQPRGFFLHVGNSLPYKNLERVLAALGDLARQRGRAPRLVKVGAPLTLPQQRLATDLGVGVSSLGEVPAEDLRGLYHLADCLLYPSLHEGFGWPVAEALACGLPVIAGRSGALPEVAGDAALFVEPTDTRAIVTAIGRLSQEPGLRDDLVARGRVQAERLAQGDFAAELLALYRAAAAERPSA